jgi:hypothetical protein
MGAVHIPLGGALEASVLPLVRPAACATQDRVTVSPHFCAFSRALGTWEDVSGNPFKNTDTWDCWEPIHRQDGGCPETPQVKI